MLKPAPEDSLNAHEVNQQVGNVRLDSPELIEPLKRATAEVKLFDL
ncbi:MAG: hypothetical protein R2880_04540 [Deinococcales bacterium]